MRNHYTMTGFLRGEVRDMAGTTETIFNEAQPLFPGDSNTQNQIRPYTGINLEDIKSRLESLKLTEKKINFICFDKEYRVSALLALLFSIADDILNIGTNYTESHDPEARRIANLISSLLLNFALSFIFSIQPMHDYPKRIKRLYNELKKCNLPNFLRLFIDETVQMALATCAALMFSDMLKQNPELGSHRNLPYVKAAFTIFYIPSLDSGIRELVENYTKPFLARLYYQTLFIAPNTVLKKKRQEIAFMRFKAALINATIDHLGNTARALKRTNHPIEIPSPNGEGEKDYLQAIKTLMDRDEAIYPPPEWTGVISAFFTTIMVVLVNYSLLGMDRNMAPSTEMIKAGGFTLYLTITIMISAILAMMGLSVIMANDMASGLIISLYDMWIGAAISNILSNKQLFAYTLPVTIIAVILATFSTEGAIVLNEQCIQDSVSPEFFQFVTITTYGGTILFNGYGFLTTALLLILYTYLHQEQKAALKASDTGLPLNTMTAAETTDDTVTTTNKIKVVIENLINLLTSRQANETLNPGKTIELLTDIENLLSGENTQIHCGFSSVKKIKTPVTQAFDLTELQYNQVITALRLGQHADAARTLTQREEALSRNRNTVSTAQNEQMLSLLSSVNADTALETGEQHSTQTVFMGPTSAEKARANAIECFISKAVIPAIAAWHFQHNTLIPLDSEVMETMLSSALAFFSFFFSSAGQTLYAHYVRKQDSMPTPGGILTLFSGTAVGATVYAVTATSLGPGTGLEDAEMIQAAAMGSGILAAAIKNTM